MCFVKYQTFLSDDSPNYNMCGGDTESERKKKGEQKSISLEIKTQIYDFNKISS